MATLLSEAARRRRPRPEKTVIRSAAINSSSAVWPGQASGTPIAITVPSREEAGPEGS